MRRLSAKVRVRVRVRVRDEGCGGSLQRRGLFSIHPLTWVTCTWVRTSSPSSHMGYMYMG